MKTLSIQTLIIGILAIMFMCGAATIEAATFTVTKATNSNDGVCDADCSLREAVAVAQSGDTVVFNSNLIGQTFTLGGSEIVITNRIVIDGTIDSVNVAFISGSGTSRIFYIQTGGGLDLRNAILVQGNGSGLNMFDQRGGAINAADGTSLVLDRVAIRGNTGADFGGAINLGNGTHHITNSSFTGNTVNNGCAAIYNDGGTANLYMANVTVSGNRETTVDGFGLGAICNNGGNLFIRNSTIANNSTDGSGGGIWQSANGDMTLGNTIVAQNSATASANDIRFVNGTITSVGGNLVGDLDTVPAGTFTLPGDTTGVNPRLAPLNSQQGGHPIETHPLQAGSPAIGAGLNANAVDPLTNSPLTQDARGPVFPRVTGGTVDKGAFEDQSNGASLVVSKLADTNDNVCDTDCSLREAVFAAGQDPGTDNITMAANVFGTMTLTIDEIGITNNDVNIIGYPTLNAGILVISGNNARRLFNLSNSTVTFTGLTMANGTGQGQSEPFGGGALVAFGGNLMLDRVIVRNSRTLGGEPGGGISTQLVNVVRIMNSTLNNNSGGQTTAASIGAGVTYVTNTTISTNTDPDGLDGFGAMSISGTLYMRNSTIANNRASASNTGAGLYCGPSATCNIGNSIFADNLASIGSDVFVQPGGTLVSVGGNLVETNSGFNNANVSQTGDQIGADPNLGPLGDNGGVVTTQSLQSPSAAINTGLNANATDPFSAGVLTSDARGAGFTRILGGTVDKGAFETAGPTAASVSVGGRVITPDGRGVRNAVVVLADQNGGKRTVTTSAFGNYKFEDVEVGKTYIVSVNSKSYRFGAKALVLVDELSNFDFTGQE